MMNFYLLYLKRIFIKNKIQKNIFIGIYLHNIKHKKKNSLRDKLINYLKKNNILTTVHYIPANYHNFIKKNLKNLK